MARLESEEVGVNAMGPLQQFGNRFLGLMVRTKLHGDAANAQNVLGRIEFNVNQSSQSG